MAEVRGQDGGIVTPVDDPRELVIADVAAMEDDKGIVKEAKARFNRISEFESTTRRNYRQDTKFCEADSDNGWQWPGGLREGRTKSNRPMLTINITRQHILQIVNEARSAKASVRVIATGGDASADAASAWRSLIRRIEYQSNAQEVYYQALRNAVRAGIGWWRLVTRYVANDSFDQDIFLQAIPDSMSVYIDPDCQQLDKSDARYGFVFGQIDQNDFKNTWPKYSSLIDGGSGQAPLGTSTVGDTGTWNEDQIWFAEYFRKIQREKTLVSFIDHQTGQRLNVFKDKLPKSVWSAIRQEPSTRTRESSVDEIQWFLIVGESIIDRTEWPGRYIPLVSVLGEETIVDGVLDRKGHTRALKDAQRLYNYNASAQAEFGALQTRTPFIADARAIEGVEVYWNRANLDNSSVLPYNGIDDNGNDIQPPKRMDPPVSAPAFEAGMQTAWMQMMMASGQWQAQMGVQGNERTGEAIKQRQGQADNAVSHYQDNLASALRYSARQFIDIIPRLYDTQRAFRILDDDGSQIEMKIDPKAQHAYQELKSIRGESIFRVLNPNIGQFDIAAEVGPSFATRREETVKTLTMILTEAPALTGIIGDLLLRNLDIDEALEAARRLKRMVPPQALGEGPSPQEQQLQQQVQQLTQVIQGLQSKLGKSLVRGGIDKVLLKGKDQRRDIEVYEAETHRMAALQKMLPMDKEGLQQTIHSLIMDALQTHLGPILAANQGEGSESESESAEGLSHSDPDITIPPPPTAANGEYNFLRNPKQMRGGMYLAPLINQRKLPG